MNSISRFALFIFEVLNEMFMAAGTGAIGVIVLLHQGVKTHHVIRNVAFASLSMATLVYASQAKERLRISKRKVVFISGCDTGLGFSLAQHLSRIGFTVVGGFLDLESEGARVIGRRGEVIRVQLDVTQEASITKSVEALEEFLDDNPKHELFALINNAAVMAFGEFEWLSDHLIQQQVDVNLLGTIRLTRKFGPLIRKSKGRIINIASHCALASLPGLAVYGATKAGICAFGDALRVELAKYGVRVITFIPGSFFAQSSIMARHVDHVKDQLATLTPEQKNFYGRYFDKYHTHLLSLKVPKKPQNLDNEQLYKEMEDALTNVKPNSYYKVEPLRYAFYHFLFKISPTPLRDYFVERFMQMPKFVPRQNHLELEFDE